MVMKIRVLTPTRVIWSKSVDEVILPGANGLVGVLKGHATLVTALETGLLRIKLNENKTWLPLILSEGLAEIDRNRVTVLVNDVEEFTNDIELRGATKELEKTTLVVEQKQTVDINDEDKENKGLLDASIELKKAKARVEGLKLLSKK